jgi:hypothetical protein
MNETVFVLGGMICLWWSYFFFLRWKLYREEKKKENAQHDRIWSSVQASDYRLYRIAKIEKSLQSTFKYNIFITVAMVLIAISEQFNIYFDVDDRILYVIGIALFFLPLLDWYTTSVAIGKLGATEANPIMSFIISKIGLDKIVFFTVPLVAIVSISLVLKGFIPLSFVVFVVVYVAVIVNNIMVIRKKMDLQKVGESVE